MGVGLMAADGTAGAQGMAAGLAAAVTQACLAEQPAAVHRRDPVDAPQIGEREPLGLSGAGCRRGLAAADRLNHRPVVSELMLAISTSPRNLSIFSCSHS